MNFRESDFFFFSQGNKLVGLVGAGWLSVIDLSFCGE